MEGGNEDIKKKNEIQKEEVRCERWKLRFWTVGTLLSTFVGVVMHCTPLP